MSTDSQRMDALRLIRSENVGAITYRQLVSFYRTPTRALEALPELARKGGRKRPITIAPLDAITREMEQIEQCGAKLIIISDDDYPPNLREVEDAPPCLTVLGDARPWMQQPVIGMVGARNGSANGCAFARKLASELGAQGFAVASGLARGIDTAAHLGSLATGTIAVVAGGINTIYPPENEGLYKQISQSGCIVTEAPFDTAPMARHFPARNRIIAGMSQGVVVIEASLQSGSLITAHNALDYGRDVFAVPGSPMDPRCKGSNDLLRNGAVLTESIHDILHHQHHKQNQLLEPSAVPFSHATPMTEPDNDVRSLLMSKLSVEPVLLDELIVQCDTTPTMIYSLLLELELAGKLIRVGAGRVALKAHALNDEAAA